MHEYLLLIIIVVASLTIIGTLLFLRFRGGIVTRIAMSILLVSSFVACAAFITGREGLTFSVFAPLFAASLFVFTIASYFIYRNVYTPFKELNRMIMSLSRDKDLSAIPDKIVRKDEFGQMQNSLVDLISSLHSFATSVIQTSEQVHIASKEMAATSMKLLTSISQETTSVQEVVSATRQMDITSDNIVRQSQKVVSDSEKLNKASQETMSRLDALHTGISHFNELVDNLSHRMTLLEQNVSQVQDIIDSVSVFADQSSVLAVNASIEAANAGEHGLGFAVVAGEVSSLARHSGNSADQIRNILSTINKSVRELSDSVSQSLGQLNRSRTDVEELSIFMNGLSRGVGNTATQSHNAMKMITEQRIGYKQINTAMEQISISSSESSRQTERMRESMVQLTEMSELLRKELTQFKL